MIFTHGGDMGDLIYSLPAIRAAGGGDLVLFNDKRTMFPMDQARFECLEQILRAQSYIHSVTLSPVMQPSVFNEFRNFGPVECNLADRHFYALKLGHKRLERNNQWLQGIPAVSEAEVVFVRSPRYQNPLFPWKRFARKFAGKAVFLGLRSEWTAFCDYVGESIRYVETSNLYEAARIINGSRLYVGNQTALTAVAEGLKHGNMVVEQNREGARWSCFFQRQGLIMGWDDMLDVEGLL